MSEQGDTPGRQRGYAGTWPPRAGGAGWRLCAVASQPHGRRSLKRCVNGLRAEAGAGRLLPWVPVAFGTGIAFYFAADHEPVLPVAAVVAIAFLPQPFCCGGRSCFPRL